MELISIVRQEEEEEEKTNEITASVYTSSPRLMMALAPG
jgi:hypothetical protein